MKPILVPGGGFAGWRRGDNLLAEGAAGRVTFEEFLTARISDAGAAPAGRRSGGR